MWQRNFMRKSPISCYYGVILLKKNYDRSLFAATLFRHPMVFTEIGFWMNFWCNFFILLKPNNCRKVFFFLLQLFASGILVMKKLEIEKTKPTFIISVLKVDIIKVGLVFSISNFFITKTPVANNWRRKKIPSCSYSALVRQNIELPGAR